jgi:hypothetical protein
VKEVETRATVLVMIRQEGKKSIKEKSKEKSRVRAIYIPIRLTS